MAYPRRRQLLLLTCIYHMTGIWANNVVDLTHAQNLQTIYWPGNPDYNFTVLYRGQNTQKGFWYESNAFATAEHGGTHLDAPAHFSEDKMRVHQIPMEKLVGPGVIINVKTKAATDPDYRVTVADVQSWETTYGRIPTGAVVIMNSGWTVKYPNNTLTFGSDTPDDPSTFHFPGWHEDAAEWLVKNRNIHMIGVDTPSVDYGKTPSFPVHVVIGDANIPGLENVANLDDIPESGTIIYGAVIKLFDGSGGPARVFATLPPMGGVNGCALSRTSSFNLMIVVLMVLACCML